MSFIKILDLVFDPKNWFVSSVRVLIFISLDRTQGKRVFNVTTEVNISKKKIN